ncbi:MAG TPA: anti-sigma factor [Solirubrobacterales bacterium]|nr:anti-sigma factor [Solirubrobacterales bacterium]
MSADQHDRRLEEVAAFALGALDAAQIEDFREHLAGCKRCQDELNWLAPAVRALPEAVEQQSPPPELKVRLMEEVRADVAAAAEQTRAAERRERASSRKGFREWLGGLDIGGLTWKPLAGMAAVILIVAAGVGYLVGNGDGTNVHTTEVPQPNGIVAEVINEDGKGELRLTGVEQLPKGKVLEAWVARGEAVEPVEMLFTPDEEGNATTQIEDLEGVDAVMVTREPTGGTKVPTTEPFVEVPLES